jgi:hypothetical protein
MDKKVYVLVRYWKLLRHLRSAPPDNKLSSGHQTTTLLNKIAATVCCFGAVGIASSSPITSVNVHNSQGRP